MVNQYIRKINLRQVEGRWNVPVIIKEVVFLVQIMAMIARRIIDVIVILLFNTITQVAQTVCVLESWIFDDHGYRG
jgi:hypothetical protein